MADVSERRIRPIQEAIESKNWKQALQLCEKWHKKGEKSDRFQATRAYVLAKQQDTTSTKRGRNEIVQLCNRTPAITDLDTIYQIQIALNELGIEDDGGRKLWERAAAAKPEDKDIAMTWLDEAIDRSDWQSAQKATMALRKSSPRDRNYEFWTIFMCYLIHEDPSLSERERKMFGTLAYRMLEKAARAVPQDSQELLSPGKAIQSPEELSLLVRVYLDTGHVRESKTLLMDSKILGPQSAIFKLDHDLHRSLQLEVLQASKDWPAVLNELRTAVKEQAPENIQISKVLGILFDAGEQQQDSTLLQELRQCLDDALNVLPDSQDLRYGMLRLLCLEKAKDRCKDADLLDACKEYFTKRREQLSCFDELRNPLQALEPKLQQDFVDYAHEIASPNFESGTSSVTPVLNALKLEYCFLISRNVPLQGSQVFACKVVKAYQHFCSTKQDTSEAGAQLAMLACMTLLRANQTEQDGTIDRDFQIVSHLQAGFLLHYCLTRIRDNYPSLVVLTRISTLLGATSLSTILFKKLSIKNLQWENAGHLLFTRLSTLHPHRSQDDEGSFEPLQLLDLAMTTNANSVRSVRRLFMVGLNHKSYTNVMETIALKEDLQRSFSRQLYCIESARTKRLRDLPSSDREPLSSGPFVDRRDFSFIPSFEHPSLPSFAECLKTGPKPKDGWLHVMKICNTIAVLLHEEYHEPQSLKQADIQDLSCTLDNLSELLQTARHELTTTELHNCTLHFHLGKALTLRLQQQQQQHQQPESPTTPSTMVTNKPTYDNIINSIQTWLTDTLKHQPSLNHRIISTSPPPLLAPTWEYLHSAFSTLESLQLIALFLVLASPPSAAKAASSSKSKAKLRAKTANPYSLSAEQNKALHDLIGEVEKKIHGSATALKRGLGGSGVLGGMVDGVFGRGGLGEEDGGGGGAVTAAAAARFGKEMERLPGAEVVAEMFCAEVRGSWEGGLDGVLGVGVARYG